MKEGSILNLDQRPKQHFTIFDQIDDQYIIQDDGYNTNFYKLVNNRILVGTITENTIVIFYFLPANTLMNSFSEEDWPNELSIIGDTKQIYAYMAGLSHQKFQMVDQMNLVIHFQLQENKYFNFPLQIMSKTMGHRLQQLKGCQIINQQLAQNLVQLKQKKCQIVNIRRYQDNSLQKGIMSLECYVLQLNKGKENKMTQVASSDFDTLAIDIQWIKNPKKNKKLKKIVDLLSDQ